MVEWLPMEEIKEQPEEPVATLNLSGTQCWADLASCSCPGAGLHPTVVPQTNRIVGSHPLLRLVRGWSIGDAHSQV